MVRLHLELEAELDPSTEIIALLQAFAGCAVVPVEILTLKEEAGLYGTREPPRDLLFVHDVHKMSVIFLRVHQIGEENVRHRIGPISETNKETYECLLIETL